MNNVKKNNKGFSLVELIVVVLIMAIIAVSLAPQVMKWVDRSRQANDSSNYDALYAAAQLSVIADPDADGTLTMNTTDTDPLGLTTAFTDAMDANLPGWREIEITSTTAAANTEYVITIDNGVVKKGKFTDAGALVSGSVPGEISAN